VWNRRRGWMAEYSGRYNIGSLESTDRKFSDWVLIKRIIRQYMVRHKSLMLMIGLILPVRTILLLAGPYIYKVVIDHFIRMTPDPSSQWLADVIRSIANALTGGSSGAAAFLLSAGLLYVSVGIMLWAFTSLQSYYMSKLGLSVIADIRTDFFKHIEKLSPSFFEYGGTGKLVSRVTNDADALKNIVSSGIIQVVADVITTIAVLVTMFIIDAQLALISLAIVPILAIVSRTLQGWVRNKWRIARQNISSMVGKIQDLMYGAKVTKAMVQEERSLGEFDSVNEANMRAQISAEIAANSFEAVVGFFTAFISAIIWFVGGLQVINVARSLGDLVAFTQYSTNLLDPVENISTFYGEIQSALAGAERIFNVLDIEPEIKDHPDAVEFPNGEGMLELKNVTFGYAKDQTVLKGISFRTKPGERLAIFGPTGSGKSSMINLIGRFYDPRGGHITMDETDLKRIKLKSIRRHVSIVLQEPYLFSGTVRYNLKFGKPNVTDEEMVRICKLVGIHDAIAKLEKGYDEEVREQGSNLSYGQRQLVCFARALIADPKILILDEATSSVDPYTESLIQNVLRKEMHNRTILIVTHRVSTVRDADRIIVLDSGVIQDVGSHDELLEKNDLYRKLCEMQLVSVTED